MHTFDLSLDHVTKVEGSAGLSVKVRDGKVEDVKFAITEYKRFFTEAMKGKSIAAIPAHLSRICGTCSNAHIMCAIEAAEQALGITPSEQTKILRALTIHGLIIRDHALHLYLFVMPDVYGKDAFLDFDENNPEQHQLLHDAFDIKAAGNFLATLVAGRSVHAPYPTIGGFLKFPEASGVTEAVAKLEAIRPAVLRLIEIFRKSDWRLDRQTNYMALVPEGSFGYLHGRILTSKGESFSEDEFRTHLEHTVMPYSQASAYQYKGETYLVGSLPRLNLAKDKLHPKTRESVAEALSLFPSTNIYHNNLAQAIEILHSIDEALEQLRECEFKPEPLVKAVPYAGTETRVGVGVVEAPRGTLYHKVELNPDGKVKQGEVIVPTGQNQLNIELDIGRLVEDLLPTTPQEKMVPEIEKLIRAYDPCMSCAAHFLKVDWDEK